MMATWAMAPASVSSALLYLAGAFHKAGGSVPLLAAGPWLAVGDRGQQDSTAERPSVS